MDEYKSGFNAPPAPFYAEHLD